MGQGRKCKVTDGPEERSQQGDGESGRDGGEDQGKIACYPAFPQKPPQGWVPARCCRASPDRTGPFGWLRTGLGGCSHMTGTIQQRTPVRVMERPMVLRMSTRSRSLLGAHPQAMTYSCRRKSRPKAKATVRVDGSPVETGGLTVTVGVVSTTSGSPLRVPASRSARRSTGRCRRRSGRSRKGSPCRRRGPRSPPRMMQRRWSYRLRRRCCCGPTDSPSTGCPSSGNRPGRRTRRGRRRRGRSRGRARRRSWPGVKVALS